MWGFFSANQVDSKKWEYFQFKIHIDVDIIVFFYVIKSSVGKGGMKTSKPQSEAMAHYASCYSGR